MDAEELTHATGKAVCVKRDNSSSDLAQGVASLWRTAAGEHLITCGEGFVMPLVGQPVLRVSRGVFVFACPPEGEVKNYVLLLRAERVGDEEAIDLFEATLAATTTVRSATGQGASAAAGGGGGGGGGGAAAAPAPAHAIVPAPAAAAPAGAAAAAGAGAGALSLAALRAQLPPAEVVGSTLSRGITSLGMGVKSALVAGATLTGMGVAAASKAIGQAVGPSAAPLKLSDTTVARMQQARVVTRSAAVLTGAMVEGAAVMARSMGAAAAAAMAESNTGKRLIAQSATPTGVAVKQVGSASLQAIKTVWDVSLRAAEGAVGAALGGRGRQLTHAHPTYGTSTRAPGRRAWRRRRTLWGTPARGPRGTLCTSATAPAGTRPQRRRWRWRGTWAWWPCTRATWAWGGW